MLFTALSLLAHSVSQQKVMNSFFWTYGRYAFDVVKGFEKNRAVTLLSVVPLKIGNNNCKPGETHLKTRSLCKIPTLERVNLAEDRHQHSKGGLPKILMLF